MLIDWFTVVAQVINFLILVWLMKRFLYQPILSAIDLRESRIAAQLADADAREAEANRERDEFRLKNAEFDADRSRLLGEAVEEAKTERLKLMEEARQAAAELGAKRRVALENEAATLTQELARRTQSEVFAIAGQVLGDLAGASLEDRAVDVFIQRLGEIDETAKAELGEAIRVAPSSGLVRTAFDLESSQRASIQHALNETFSADIQLVFETAPELVGGIEFVAQGRKVAWSIAEYLRSLQDGAAELLRRQVETEAAP